MKTSVTYTFINFTVFSLQKVVTHSKLPQDTSVNIQIYTRETQQWVGTITFYVISCLSKAKRAICNEYSKQGRSV